MNARIGAFTAERLTDGVMVVILLSGVLKAFDVTVFAESLATWRFLPTATRPLLAVGVPAIELAVSLALLLGLWRRLAFMCVLLLVSAFTLAYVIHIILFSEAPKCGCFGPLDLGSESLWEARVLIARNVVLLGALGAAVLLRKYWRYRHAPTHSTKVG